MRGGRVAPSGRLGHRQSTSPIRDAQEGLDKAQYRLTGEPFEETGFPAGTVREPIVEWTAWKALLSVLSGKTPETHPGNPGGLWVSMLTSRIQPRTGGRGIAEFRTGVGQRSLHVPELLKFLGLDHPDLAVVNGSAGRTPVFEPSRDQAGAVNGPSATWTTWLLSTFINQRPSILSPIFLGQR